MKGFIKDIVHDIQVGPLLARRPKVTGAAIIVGFIFMFLLIGSLEAALNKVG